VRKARAPRSTETAEDWLVGMAGTVACLSTLFLCGLYAFNAVRPNLTGLAWPALFISLGWVFLQYGEWASGADVRIGF
jgi:hypothetical protein